MAVRLTAEAVALIRRSLELARLDTEHAGVRLRLVGGDVRPRFAERPEPGDEIVEHSGVRVFVDARIVELAPNVDIGVSSEHEQLVVRPSDR